MDSARPRHFAMRRKPAIILAGGISAIATFAAVAVGANMPSLKPAASQPATQAAAPVITRTLPPAQPLPPEIVTIYQDVMVPSAPKQPKIPSSPAGIPKTIAAPSRSPSSKATTVSPSPAPSSVSSPTPDDDELESEVDDD